MAARKFDIPFDAQLPYELQCELNLAVRSLRRSKLPELRIRLARREDRFHRPAALICVQCRRGKVGAIESVEGLRAELHVEGLGNLSYVVVLDHGEIDVNQSGAND